jgi:hypothetical protein
MILYLLLILSCMTLSLLSMDPNALWRAAQHTNHNWHQILSSVSSAISESKQHAKTNANTAHPSSSGDMQVKEHHEQK